MSPAAAAVDHMDQEISLFVGKHGERPKGIRLGRAVVAELKRQNRISDEPVQARLSTSHGESPWVVDWGKWPMLDKAIFVHELHEHEWGCLLPTRP
jgi:hypothetical protein